SGNRLSGFPIPDAGSDCFFFMTPITSVGNNLVSDPTDCGLQSTDLTRDPGLGSLVGTEEDALPGRAYYPVLAGSPVINGGNPSACPRTDQLANSRDGVCDIGSIELQSGIPVAINIKPRDDNNSIRLNGDGTISV